MDKDLACTLIEKVKKLTSDKYCSVINIEGTRQNVTRFANSEISQNTNKSDINMSLTLHDGRKEATCGTNVLNDEGLQRLVKDAESLLAISPQGNYEFASWGKPSLHTTESDKELRLIYDAKGRAETIKEGIKDFETDFTAAGALVLENKISAYGNSYSDEVLFASLDNVQFNTVVTHKPSNADGGGECISHQANQLNIKEAFSHAKHWATLGSDTSNLVTLNGGEYTVVLSPMAVGNLVAFLGWSLNAKRVADGLSFCNSSLSNAPKLGENINIYDDVNDSRVFPWYFDYEGNKRQTIPLIEKGVVKNLLYDNKTAHLLGAEQKGHAYSNKGNGGASLHTIMLGGDSTQEEVIKSTTRGLYISDFHYTNFVNPCTLQLTGLTRNGTFLIEDGQITKPVTTMRFTQNILEAFTNVEVISKELTVVNDDGWASVMPSIKIERFCFP
ncbi:MAG: TldD/PmbA family protein [Defluviitaleaceae bacterium]|nr:TldD/PmbA family protein [Defluviitaleaceae bacterium]